MARLNECGCNSEMDHSNTNNYMFFQNLKTIKKMVDAMLQMDPAEVDQMLSNGHGWAVDHIATSKDDVEEVGGFLMNSEQKDHGHMSGHMHNDVAYNTQKPQFVPVTLDSPEKMKGFIREIIRKVKDGYRLYSHSGRNMGTYPTKSGAKKRERQVQYFKHKK